MKNVNCEQFKPTNKNGQTEKCHCRFLNRHWARDMKFYKITQKLNKKG